MTIQDAPATPLNLQFGIWYRPRREMTPFEAFMCIEPNPNKFHIVASMPDGRQRVVVQADSTFDAYRAFAQCLRMDQ